MTQDVLDIKTIQKECEKLDSFLTIKEVGCLLRVDYYTIYRLIVIGELDATKVAGVWRIPKCALCDYLQKRHPFNTEYI